MADEKKEFSAVSAIRTFFGMKPGEDLRGFMEELKSLTAEDKKWLGEETAKALGGKIQVRGVGTDDRGSR